MSGALAGDFRDYIVAHIDEDTPRLAYADWLQEQGRDERAEFIRVQVERAQLPTWHPAQVRLALRERTLIERYGEEWLAELPVIEGARWEGFRRGIVAEVSFASFEAMRKNAHACRAAAPVEAVTVRWPRRREGGRTVNPIAELRELTLTGNPDYDAFEWVAGSPQLATLRGLTARSLWGASLGVLAGSPHLANLKSLCLPSNNLGNEGIFGLAKAVTLSALEELDFSSQSRHERYIHDPVIRAAGMGALIGWSGLATVRALTLNGNDVSRDGLRALLRSPHVAGLKHLSLRDGQLDGQAMAEFDSARPDLRLETLDLGQNVLQNVGAEYVALAPCLCELKALRLDRCEVRLTGARVLAKKAAFLDGLRLLDIGHNHFGPAGLGALLERPPAALHTLRVRDNDLTAEGAELLAAAPASDTLLELDLCRNRLGARAVRALGEAEHLRGLLVLRLADNPIRARDAEALAASPLGRRLAVLELEAPEPDGPGADQLEPDEPDTDEPIPF
ncbi:TIGR02996 domain-containing protein [Gemmata obscuriglobus]|uniref:TIGR02996 domain-containing protein n=1 Tax=Gemmata obscuriglobus TaxID=114 RepID=A0A2Z3H7G8_9BACT|nr:TIGR02996 domain-containing protein [Gemmata obscuriglobus]AWM38925.1 TIGR02996 domain-containing protein [Gemmata obscuriglobus]VTS05674.1 Repeat-companion domain protein OS=Isosphaera pallida (strain ATCC 43644 / DSM 9630 / IS1B) GN=Isop_0391 PE=4 SV=1: LRR_6 [Gemmata obscuriglobus UQM 2246]